MTEANSDHQCSNKTERNTSNEDGVIEIKKASKIEAKLKTAVATLTKNCLVCST